MTAFRVAATAIAALIVLSGCTTPAAMPDLGGSEVVLVTTSVTAPNGARLDLAMTTYYPVTVASAEGQAILAYLRDNGDTSDVSDDAFLAENAAVLQLSTITAVDASPGTAWPSAVGATPRLGPGYVDTLIGLPLTRDSLGWPHIVGAASGYGVAALYGLPETGDITVADWANFWTFYGFENRSFEVEVSNCEIVTTALAQESPQVFTWTDVPYNCMVGIGH